MIIILSQGAITRLNILFLKVYFTKSNVFFSFYFKILLYIQMAMYEKDMKAGVVDEPTVHRIRITLTSGNVKSLEKGENGSF